MSRFNKLPLFVPVSRYVRAYTTVQAPMTLRKYNDLRIHEFKGSSTGEIVHGYYDDVALLLMQKKYDKVNNLEYQSFMKDFSLNVSNVRKPVKPKMTDDQLFKYIKAKNCQSASEVSAWFDYISSQYDIVKSEYDENVRKIKEVRERESSSLGDPGSSSGDSAGSGD